MFTTIFVSRGSEWELLRPSCLASRGCTSLKYLSSNRAMSNFYQSFLCLVASAAFEPADFRWLSGPSGVARPGGTDRPQIGLALPAAAVFAAVGLVLKAHADPAAAGAT